MSNRLKIGDKADRRGEALARVIKKRYPNLNELIDLLDLSGGGTVKIRDGFGFREVNRGGLVHLNFISRLEDELGGKISKELVEKLKDIDNGRML